MVALPVDHGKNTRSAITTIWNSTTPMTDRMISAPNATGTLKKAVEVTIRKPSPESAFTNSATTAPTAREKTEARKEADKLTKTLHECEEWERQTVLPLAQARIELDLDDGVKTNYLKLGEALATIAGLAGKEEE